MEENKRDEIEIDLGELFRAIMSKFLFIVIAAVLFGGGAYAYTKVCVKPQYTSSTKVYILNKTENENVTTSDLAFATALAKDYQVLMISDPVLKQVIEDLGLNMTTKGLASCISVNLIEDTRILQISVTAGTPADAKRIADAVRDRANEKTKSVMGGIEAVNAVDEATLPNAPSSPNVLKNTILGAMGGIVLVVIIAIVLFLIDDTIKTPEDIERYLGLSVLASIPMQKDKTTSSKKKNKKKKKEA